MTDLDAGFSGGFQTVRGTPDLFDPATGKPALSRANSTPVIVDEEAIAAPARSESRPPAASKPEAAITDTAAVDHDARIAEAERRLAALQQPLLAAPTAPDLARPPKRADFDDYAEYDAALVEYGARRALAERTQQDGERLTAERQWATQQASVELFSARCSKYAAANPGFDIARIAAREDLKITPVMAATIALSAHGPAIADFFDKHPAEAERIAAVQQPEMVAFEFGKIAASLEAAPARRQSQSRSQRAAPAQAAPAQAARAPREEDMNTYAARRLKELAAERRPGMFGR